MKTFDDPMRTKRFYAFSQQTLNLEVKGQGENLRALQLFLWFCVFELQSVASIIGAPLSPLLSQRKGIRQGTGGLSRSPVPKETGLI